MRLRPIVPVIAALALSGCGDALEGIGDLSARFVHGDTSSTTTFTTLTPPGQGPGLVGLSGEVTWVNDEFGVEPGLAREDLIRRVWLRGDGVSPYVQASRREIAAVLPGIEFLRLIPEGVTHISSQLVFDVQTGTLDVSTAAAFGLWTGEPYTVPRTEAQLVVLRVGIRTVAEAGEQGEIFTFQVPEGRELAWTFGDHVYQLFCRTGLSEQACFTMAESTTSLELLSYLPGGSSG